MESIRYALGLFIYIQQRLKGIIKVTSLCMHSKWFGCRSISCLSIVIVWMSVVLKRTVVRYWNFSDVLTT